MSRFVVHENFNPSHDYTRIHLADCSFAKPEGTQTDNTNWYGPFENYKTAYLFAGQLNRRHGPFNCAFCRPQLFE